MTAFTRIALTGFAATGLALGAAATDSGAVGPTMPRAAVTDEAQNAETSAPEAEAPDTDTGAPEAEADLAQGIVPESKGWVVVPKSREYASAETATSTETTPSTEAAAPSTEEVRAMIEDRLDRRGNDRIEVGEIRRADGGTVVAEIVTRDGGEVVETIEFDEDTTWTPGTE